jgi:hypothetical protein
MQVNSRQVTASKGELGSKYECRETCKLSNASMKTWRNMVAVQNVEASIAAPFAGGFAPVCELV